jgi:hypothetical protein
VQHVRVRTRRRSRTGRSPATAATAAGRHPVQPASCPSRRGRPRPCTAAAGAARAASARRARLPATRPRHETSLCLPICHDHADVVLLHAVQDGVEQRRLAKGWHGAQADIDHLGPCRAAVSRDRAAVRVAPCSGEVEGRLRDGSGWAESSPELHWADRSVPEASTVRGNLA